MLRMRDGPPRIEASSHYHLAVAHVRPLPLATCRSATGMAPLRDEPWATAGSERAGLGRGAVDARTMLLAVQYRPHKLAGSDIGTSISTACQLPAWSGVRPCGSDLV